MKLSTEVRVSSEDGVLTQKISEDLQKMSERKSKSQLRKPDWI